jgi:hypothetical protein
MLSQSMNFASQDVIDHARLALGDWKRKLATASLHVPFTPTRPPAENTAEKQRVRQQMLARNWHDDAISPELGSFCQKSHLIAGLIDLS